MYIEVANLDGIIPSQNHYEKGIGRHNVLLNMPLRGMAFVTIDPISNNANALLCEITSNLSKKQIFFTMQVIKLTKMLVLVICIFQCHDGRFMRTYTSHVMSLNVRQEVHSYGWGKHWVKWPVGMHQYLLSSMENIFIHEK